MTSILSNSLEQGLISSFMAMGVLLSFRMLGFPDLTVEGTFPLSAAICARLLVGGANPIFATLAGVLGGALAGIASGLVHTKLKVNNILAGILVTSGIYTLMLRVMGRPNTPLLTQRTIFDQVLGWFGLRATVWPVIGMAAVLTVLAFFLMNWFLHTDLGLTIRATGNNETMIRSLGVDTDGAKVTTLAIANGLVALSGALVAQDQGFADVGMGMGSLVTAVASLIIGETLFGSKNVTRHLSVLIIGSLIYRILLNIGLRLGLPASDFKLITALLVLAMLSAPLWHRTGRRKGTEGRRSAA